MGFCEGFGGWISLGWKDGCFFGVVGGGLFGISAFDVDSGMLVDVESDTGAEWGLSALAIVETSADTWFVPGILGYGSFGTLVSGIGLGILADVAYDIVAG